MRFGETPGGSVRELIRAAEKFIAAGEYGVAMDQLMNARKIQPGNAYIAAIMERIHALQTEKDRSDKAAAEMERNPFMVTVGEDYPGSRKRERDDDDLTPKEIEVQVRRLTMMAQTLLERGSFESAFDTLMKAYLLDPVSPYVLACEQDLLPAWELLRKRKGEAGAPAAEPGRAKSSSPSGSGVDLRKSESARIEALRQQKALERLERERAMWREASMPPKVIPQDSLGPAPGFEPDPEAKKTAPRLLTKFRFGRLLS